MPGHAIGSHDLVFGGLCLRNAIATLSLPGPGGRDGPLEVPVRLLGVGIAGLLVDQPIRYGEAVPVADGAAVMLTVPTPAGPRLWSARVVGRVGFRPSALSSLALESLEPAAEH